MAFASYGSTLKISGTAVVITNEACTGLGGSVWQVTTAARRILDTATAIVVKDATVTVASTLYTIDFLFGKITFIGYTPGGAITLTGAYLPLLAIAEVKSFSIDLKQDLADVTTLDSGGAKQKLATLDDFTVTFDFLSLPTADLDGVAVGTQSITSWREAGTPKLIELKVSGTPHYFRGWGLFDGTPVKSAVGDVNTFTATLQGSSQVAGAAWSFGT